MRAVIFLVLSLSIIGTVSAAGNNQYPLEHADVNLHNTAALQRGAKYFINYCLSCHSAKYSRYNRVAKDLGIEESLVKENLMFTQQNVGDLMTITMTEESSLQWFGAVPPDLTLVNRYRGSDWLYTYLKTFYLDDSRPMGVNNALFQNVAMPHALWELQGWQEPVYKTITHEDASVSKIIDRFEIVKPGLVSPKEYDRIALDVVTFLAYLSEPIATHRQQMGISVILFLFFLLGLCYLLKREYWKDIH